MAELRAFMPTEQRTNVAKIAALLKVSDGAAVAIQLCREAIRDYCPPDENAKVIAALVGLWERRGL
jgi:hypothetical protein